jgi:hypothetical protein
VEKKYRWRLGYSPKFNTKNGPANRRTYEALSDYLEQRGPQSQDALERYAKSFTWHHQYSVNVPGGVEYVRWHISHGNLEPA